MSSAAKAKGASATAAAAAVDDPSPLRDVRLYTRLPLHLRLDVWPFAIVYAGLVGVARRAASDSFEAGLVVGLGFLLHALAVLSTHWSVGSFWERK